MAVKKIDELARMKGLNRSEYIREMILDLSVLKMKDNMIDQLEKQIQANNILMESMTDSFSELVSVMKELIVDE